jgi:hypothetical protein
MCPTLGNTIMKLAVRLTALSILVLSTSCDSIRPVDNAVGNLVTEGCGLPSPSGSFFVTPTGGGTTDHPDLPGYQMVTVGASTTHIFGDPNIVKIVIILPAGVTSGTFNLSTTYLSYTIKNGSDTPKVWKATSGTLQVTACPSGGGTGWGADGKFEPLSSTATGELNFDFSGKS